MFFKKYSISEKKKGCNITLKWSFNMCKHLFKYSRPTSVNTADHFFWKNMCVSCLRKSGGIYTGRMETNGLFLLQNSFTLPYLSGLIWINPKPKGKTKDLATTLVSGIVARPLVLLFFFGFFLFRQRADTCPYCHSAARSWDNRSSPNCRQFTRWLLIWQMMR